MTPVQRLINVGGLSVREVKRGIRSGVAAALIMTSLSACTQPEASSVEARVRALVDTAEARAEARDIRGFVELLSDDYSDDRGNKKQSAGLLLNYYLSSNRSVHLLTRTAQVKLADSSNAEMLVFVAMAGRPITGVEQLGSLRADLFHFFVTAAEEGGEWRIIRSRWGRGWDVEGLEEGFSTNPLRR